MPKKAKWVWLLIASYFFYMAWDARFMILLVIKTLITFYCGILIDKSNGIEDVNKRIFHKKLWLAVSIIANLAILFFFKYFDFAVNNINGLLSALHMQLLTPGFSVILPVGISFYTFQALSYSMDIYRGDVKVEKNLGKYALFVAFFPQLIAGPIERAKNLLKQVNVPHFFDYERVKNGLLLMVWGYFEKMVIADRLSVLVNQVYNNYQNYPGSGLALATVLFAVQIYCDFAGYTDIAIGAAQVLGFDLMLNFKRPYFATSIQDFWRRWHISLSSWFRDYLYIPLGGSRVSKPKKYRNSFITFLVSGLWHGASWNFAIWGGIHGIYLIIGDMLKPVKTKLAKALKINTEAFIPRLIKIIITFILVCFAWIFFKAKDAGAAFAIIGKIFTNFTPSFLLDGSVFKLGLDEKDFILIAGAIGILFIIGLLREKQHRLRKELAEQKMGVRWAVYLVALFLVIIFGVYGPGYNASEFIYFQF